MTAAASCEGSVLVAAFEPFEGRRRNRSWEVARTMAARPGLETLQLPVDHQRLQDLVPGLSRRRPRCLLLLGESPGDTLGVEQLALNVRDCERPDNSGRKPLTDVIVADGPLALRAPWDARALAGKMRDLGIPAEASFHAGTFACNAAFYLALRALGSQTAVGFLHVPIRRWPLGVRLGELVRAVEVCLQELADPRCQPVLVASQLR